MVLFQEARREVVEERVVAWGKRLVEQSYLWGKWASQTCGGERRTPNATATQSG